MVIDNANKNSIFSKHLVFVIISTSLFIIVTLSGCCSYKDLPDKSWHGEYKRSGCKPYTQPATGVYSPDFIFGSQKKSDKSRNYANSEQFGRRPWPTSEQAAGYVNDQETISYREYRYDKRYIGYNNQPKTYFRSDLRAVRIGKQHR